MYAFGSAPRRLLFSEISEIDRLSQYNRPEPFRARTKALILGFLRPDDLSPKLGPITAQIWPQASKKPRAAHSCRHAPRRPDRPRASCNFWPPIAQIVSVPTHFQRSPMKSPDKDHGLLGIIRGSTFTCF